jgi:hypothetical protein
MTMFQSLYGQEVVHIYLQEVQEVQVYFKGNRLYRLLVCLVDASLFDFKMHG